MQHSVGHVDLEFRISQQPAKQLVPFLSAINDVQQVDDAPAKLGDLRDLGDFVEFGDLCELGDLRDLSDFEELGDFGEMEELGYLIEYYIFGINPGLAKKYIFRDNLGFSMFSRTRNTVMLGYIN